MSHPPLDMQKRMLEHSHQLRQRAEKAEAELAALKVADAHRTVALNGACFVISVIAGERYDHGLGDNYSEEIVDDARKRLEGLSD